MKKGDEGEQNISCDSKFMLGMMDKLGNSTRSTYRSIGVVDEEIIYLVVDNAGGHGANEAVLEYSEYLTANYNIVIHHQVPLSSETNMLDHGVWMTVQSKVEQYHRRNVKQHDDLAWFVKKAWRDVEEQKLTKIWERFFKVLDLITQDQGGNNPVESNRGLTGVLEENVENDSSGDESNEEQ